jgi:hypothetical protein
MIVDISEQFGIQLSGRLNGKKHFGKAAELLSDVRPGECVVFNFKNVEYVSGSWINAMLVPIVRRGAEDANDFFIFLTNFPRNSIDDLQLVAEQARVPFLITNNRSITRAELIGVLDAGQRATLAAVQELGETTGADLERKRPKENTKATAWNNRLRDLFEKRLLRRRKQGREQFYAPIVAEVIFNG